MKLSKNSFAQVPLYTLPSAVLDKAAVIPPPETPRRILVVDDDRRIADTLVHILVANGHTAEAVYSGREGVSRARILRPDVIISDIGMPEMDGISMVDAINGFLPHIKVVIICEQLPRNLAIPNWTVLKKPVNAIDLLAAVGADLEALASLSALELI
jgi:CheY-like chemotaxis protein